MNLARLQIPPSPSPTFDRRPQPVTLDGQPLFMAQTPIATFHPGALPLAMGAIPHTAATSQLPPNAPSMHRSRPSMALAPANIPLPATPGVNTMQFNGVFLPNNMPLAPPLLSRPSLHNRRSHSVSLGGPPKAVLGGPKRQDSSTTNVAGPDAPTASSTSGVNLGPASDVKGKMKKCVVKLPTESTSSQNESVDFLPFRTRQPIKLSLDEMKDPTGILEIFTAEAHPDLHNVGHKLAPPIEVFLPRKVCPRFRLLFTAFSLDNLLSNLWFTPPFLVQESWQEYKNAIIEEKLAKLGVEPGTQQQSPVPFILGHLHARAASVCAQSSRFRSDPDTLRLMSTNTRVFLMDGHVPPLHRLAFGHRPDILTRRPSALECQAQQASAVPSWVPTLRFSSGFA